MQTLCLQLLTIVLVYNNFISEIHAFSYQNFGEWLVESSQCGGKQQSPVNINIDEVKIESQYRYLKFNNYDQKPKKMMIRNNGHTVELTADWFGVKPTISGTPLQDQYFLDSIHFHWGRTDSEGSEHTFSNHSFPLEMHMVHVNTKYNSAGIAKNHKMGLLVIGILFNIDENYSTLAPILNSVTMSKLMKTKTAIQPVSLSIFRLSESENFYTYSGSLTTPPCSESVRWLIPTTPRRVTESQLQLLRKVNLAHGDKMNFRPTQPLNGRVVKIIKGV